MDWLTEPIPAELQWALAFAAVVALILAVMALPAALQSLFGRPHLTISCREERSGRGGHWLFVVERESDVIELNYTAAYIRKTTTDAATLATANQARPFMEREVLELLRTALV